jgi:hypothetical protein
MRSVANDEANEGFLKAKKLSFNNNFFASIRGDKFVRAIPS